MKIYREEHISMALPPGDMEYLYYINFFVKEIRRTGHLQRILHRYFDSDAWIPDSKKNPEGGNEGGGVDPQHSSGGVPSSSSNLIRPLFQVKKNSG